jgi:predicted phage terminase large subunit-like protein
VKLDELIKKARERDLSDASALQDLFDVCRLYESENFEEAHSVNKEVRRLSAKYAKEQNSFKMFDLNKRSLLFDAPYDFDAAIRYAEWDREPKKKFYMPRRKQLLPVVKAMQRLSERKIRILGVMAPPGVGKTTIELMFMVMEGLKNPDLSILMGSHSNSFLRGAYEEVGRMLDPKGEYLWKDIFPSAQVCKTNAQDMRIDLGKRKRFETFEFSSIGSGNAGKVRASNLLVADDLVPDIESAMSKERMDKLWQQYYTDLMQRMIGDCVQLLVQTPWTLHDPIDRLELAHAEDPLAEFIHLPALDENDESNFDYPYGLGFTTAFYHNQRDVMDDASWRALYMTQPIEREGQLYNEDELRRYFELPDGKPDAILFVCDTKDKGTDYCVMPICYQYGNDFYCEDVVCDNSNPEVVEARLVSKLLQHKAQMGQFESNSAGGKVAEKVQKEVKEAGGIAKITTKYTTQQKETKIIVNSPWVKDHVLFKDNSVIKKGKEYRRMLNFLCGYTMAGKNKHDDVPDALAMFAEYVQQLEGNKVEVFRRPF